MNLTTALILLATVVAGGIAAAEANTKAQAADWQESEKKARHGIRAVEASKQNPPTPESIKHGRWLYGVYCNHCHGLQGKGDGPAAKHLTTRPADLTALSQKFPNQHFFLQIALGKGRMPTWGDTLEESEMWALTHYIQTLAPQKK